MMKTLLISDLACGLAATRLEAQASSQSKIERFDQDPKWIGQNNMLAVDKPLKVIQDFGYSPTNHAGGKTGEIGGRLMRSGRSATYGKALERVMTLDEPLSCSGRFVVMETGGSASLFFGWYNSETTESSYPRNCLRMVVSGENTGCEIAVGYTTAHNQSEGPRVTGVGPRGAKVRDFNKIPVNTVYTFDLRYDPTGNSGTGQVTFTLGGDGPYTAKDVKFNIHPEHRKVGARFDRFGMVNSVAEPGSPLIVFFDDLTINGEAQSFDQDPNWVGRNNRLTFDDTFKKGAHQFGYSASTQFAGGEKGEIGGLIFSADEMPGYYADDVGRLTLDDRLVASGKIALTKLGSEAGLYLGWFNSRERGFPPRNLIGVVAEGPNSTGSMFRPIYASSDPKIAAEVSHAQVINQFGKAHDWKIEYDPAAAGGYGLLVTWLDGQRAELKLDPAARKQNAEFDRFGLAVYQGGGQWSVVYLDDVTYTVHK